MLLINRRLLGLLTITFYVNLQVYFLYYYFQYTYIEPNAPIIIGFSPDTDKLDFTTGEEVTLFCEVNATVPTADILWTDSKVVKIIRIFNFCKIYHTVKPTQ